MMRRVLILALLSLSFLSSCKKPGVTGETAAPNVSQPVPGGTAMHAMQSGPICRSEGFGAPCFQLQVLRNQSCGNTWIGAASGPRLCTVIRISTSSGDAWARTDIQR